MATATAKQCEFSEKDTLFAGRFVYDVLGHTLTRCGFPQTKLPSTDCGENIYVRANFLRVASSSVLRISLLMREEWKPYFISRRTNFESNDDDIPLFLGKIALSCSLIRTRTMQSTVELLLASCHEILLFFDSEGIDIDVIKLMKAISAYILFIIGPGENIPEKIEGLFDVFDNVQGYARWITRFIKKFAIPYGSREDVSDLFIDRIQYQYRLTVSNHPETSPLDILKDHLGFLPRQLFSAVTGKEPVNLPENLATGSSLPKDWTFPELEKLPTGVMGGSKSREGRLTESEEQTAKGEYSTKETSKLRVEDDLGQLNLTGKKASQTSHGAKKNRKHSKKKSDKK